jgi:ribosomal protein S18 acetylase RimI-like enzyme
MAAQLRPRSLVWATDIDVLPADRVVERRDPPDGPGHLVVRSPSNPGHYWGNFLVFDEPPQAGGGARFEAAFAAAFPQASHRTLCWDVSEGEEGASRAEFLERGYRMMMNGGLIAHPEELVRHPRANREVEIRRLDPAADADTLLWEGSLALDIVINNNDPDPIDDYEPFARRRRQDLRELFSAGHGGWYVALDPESGSVVGACGVVATGPRGRFQSVATHPEHERRGICRRLVAQAGSDAAARHGLRDLVIVADTDGPAFGIYESLGFQARERAVGVWRRPQDIPA